MPVYGCVSAQGAEHAISIQKKSNENGRFCFLFLYIIFWRSSTASLLQESCRMRGAEVISSRLMLD